MATEFQLILPNQIKISSKLKEEEIISLNPIHKQDMGTSYIWYQLEPCEISGEIICLSICFYKGQCESISLAIHNPQKYGSGWDDWSEEKEIARAKDTEEWLKKMGYPCGNYSWGNIWAGYDPKGGSGHAGVRFNK